MIVYKKGYQEFQEPYSSVTTKVKGLSLTDLTRSGPEFPLYGGVHVWDSSDFVVPPEVQTFSSNYNNWFAMNGRWVPGMFGTSPVTNWPLERDPLLWLPIPKTQPITPIQCTSPSHLSSHHTVFAVENKGRIRLGGAGMTKKNTLHRKMLEHTEMCFKALPESATKHASNSAVLDGHQHIGYSSLLTQLNCI